MKMILAVIEYIVVTFTTVYSGFPTNVNNIFNAYAAACGLNFCNTSLISLPYFHENLTYLYPVCPICYCNDCTLNENCCPDVGIYVTEVKCMNEIVYNPSNRNSEYYFSVIDSCPADTDQKILNLCQNSSTLAEKLSLTPVTGESGKTYRNVYCAQCNKELNFQSWTLDIKCEEFADFNFLSSFDEIVEVVRFKKCTVMYVHNNIDYNIQRCVPEREELIGQCNITGTWTLFDDDINWACSNFQLPFDNFKNIFCFICNPPLLNQDTILISDCQKADSIEFDHVLEEACRLYNRSSATSPFKNVFCYQCYRKTDINRYSDINGEFTASVKNNSLLLYIMRTGRFTNEFLLQILLSSNYTSVTSLSETPRINSTNVFYDDEREVNMTNLMTLYTSVYGPNLCGIYNFDPDQPRPYCSCFQGCLSWRDCCIDFELDHNLSCLDNYVVTNTCRFVDKGMNAGCSQKGDMIHDLPVVGISTQEHYTNIFCAMCADDYVNTFSIDPLRALQQFGPWNIQIRCHLTNPLPVYFQLSVKEIIETAKQRNCSINFEPEPVFSIFCSDTSKTINKCNVTGTWTNFEADVVWACEKKTYLSSFMGYRNVFCTLCNPGIQLFSTTTATTTKRQTTQGVSCYNCINTNVVITFRSLFQLSDNKEETISKCTTNQVFDTLQKKCRRILCSPGYILMNSTCEPLLQITSRLGYIVPVRIETFISINPLVFYDFLEQIRYQIQPFFMQYLNLYKEPEMLAVHMVTNVSCDTNEELIIEILASIEIFIDEFVPRKDVEMKLVNLHNGFLPSFPALISLEHGAIDTKQKINNEAQFTGKCYLSKTDSTVERSHAYYRFNPVSELMICNQVDLEKQEIEIEKSGFTLKYSNIKVSKWNYRMQQNGSARICVDTLNSLRKPPVGADPILSILMTVAAAISMVCLLMTFVTYCLFPSLRSVPGRNNMSLVFSLFVLQAVFIFVANKTENNIFCKSIGIILHFFLLSTFTCLSVCTFHMFKAFRSICVPHATDRDNRTFLFYSLYAYCVPAVIIVINISTSVSSAKSIGYGERGGICFLEFSYAVIGSLIVPAVIICVCNMIFFAITLWEISSVPKMERTSSHNNIRRNSIVYVKLFSLTGATWVLQIVDAFLPMTYLSIIVSLMNALQGVYIFLSYMCNERVFKMYRHLFGCRREKLEYTDTKLTTNSSLTTRDINQLPNPTIAEQRSEDGI